MTQSETVESTPNISILMPVYNEITSISAILDRVKAALPGITKEIVVVDDGSRDGTRAWLADNFPLVCDESSSGNTARINKLSSECVVRVVFHAQK
jgi:glycosyltransferase involved in cell wall biosynthesis